jgi:anaerobic magnesium-protoporphyrin IX monomethyl ester cyclase
MSNSPFPIIAAGVPDGPRNTSRPVLLIGFQEQANLGLGYLASTLREQGYRVEVFDFEADPEIIVDAAREMRPVLIGFSLIFQFYIDRFRNLMRLLRSAGVSCHFTIGGHFPSLSYEQTLDLIPELDTVVRFEGELTLLELVDSLADGREWREIQGIAYRNGTQVITTAPRPLVDNLDRFPFPERTNKRKNTILGRVATSLIASRGCARTCSFCSIHMFYRAVPGKVVRTRKPKHVVEEMQLLHQDYGATIFLFQDDDFPLFGPVWRRWTSDLLSELHRSGLAKKVIWKMNCRADVVEADLFSAMREAGLYLVYMGLESGTEQGLETLHKQISVEQNVRAVETLKSIGLGFEYGFMLFDPSSTFESVRANIGFLRRIVGDGSAAATFCRMIPYDGTPIKEQLIRQGRFKGDINHPDYDFLDPRLNECYLELADIVDVTGWIHGHRALSPQLNWAWHETAVLERLFPPLEGLDGYKRFLARVTAESNEMLFGLVEQLVDVYTEGAPRTWSSSALQERCGNYLAELVSTRDSFVLRHQETLLRALEPAVDAVCA